MSAPILQNQSAFDATTAHSFQFEYTGDQVFASKLYIYRNDNNNLVYSEKITSFQLNHTLPQGTLSNGYQYYATLTVFNVDNVESAHSNKILFYCYTQPTFIFSNIADNQIVQNSTLSPVVSYSQPEGETLDQFQIFLCNASKTQIATSGIKYGTESLAFTFNGLTDGTAYYVRATGVTTQGMQLDTDYIAITVKYTQAGQFYKLQLENNPHDASITLSSNVSIITGVSTGNPNFVEDNTMIDLTPVGCTVRFEEGFIIKEKFTLEIVGKMFYPYETILEMPVDTGTMSIVCMQGTFPEGIKLYFLLEVISPTGFIYKTCTSPIPTDYVSLTTIRVRKENDIYGIYCEVNP